MCDNKYARLIGDKLCKFTCWEIKDKKDQWLREFKELNRLKEDHRLFIGLQDALNDFLSKCKYKSFSKEDQDREKDKYEFEQSMRCPFFNKHLMEHYTPEEATKKPLYHALKDKDVI